MTEHYSVQGFDDSGRTGLVFVVGLAAAVFLLMFMLVQGKVQTSIVDFLSQELQGQGVPLVSVTVVQETPLHVRVALQSASQSQDVAIEDSDHVLSVQNTVRKAQREGYEIENLIIAIVNQQGEQIFLLETPVPQETASRQ